MQSWSLMVSPSDLPSGPLFLPRKRTQWHDHNVSGRITVDHLVNSISSMFNNRGWGRGVTGGDPLCTILGQACSYSQETGLQVCWAIPHGYHHLSLGLIHSQRPCPLKEQNPSYGSRWQKGLKVQEYSWRTSQSHRNCSQIVPWLLLLLVQILQ